MYKKVIIIDHHATFEDSLRKIAASEEAPSSMSENSLAQTLLLVKKVLPNVDVIFDLSKSGATLSLAFFTKVFGFRNYLSTSAGAFLEESCSLVEIYDTKSRYCERAEAYCANIHSMKYDFNARKNPVIFAKLLAAHIEANIHLGKRILQAKQLLVKELLKKKFLFHIGGRHAPHAKCYAVISTDM